jgi:hypothetical protein
MKRFAALLIIGKLTLIGAWAVASSFPSAARVAQESHDNIKDYRPVCGKHEMQPGEWCVRFGKDEPLTYQERVDKYNAENTPEGIRKHYAARRLPGVAALLIAAVGLALVVGSSVRSRRQRAPAGLPPVSP